MNETTERRDRFKRRYRLPAGSVLDEIEHDVIGVVYGANGYTTAEQAIDIAAKLGLGPGTLLLEVGGGRGWPSLFMAAESGCDVVVTDQIFDGLHATSSSQRFIQMAGRGLANADAVALPFRSESFDAVVHADLLC